MIADDQSGENVFEYDFGRETLCESGGVNGLNGCLARRWREGPAGGMCQEANWLPHPSWLSFPLLTKLPPPPLPKAILREILTNTP